MFGHCVSSAALDGSTLENTFSAALAAVAALASNEHRIATAHAKVFESFLESLPKQHAGSVANQTYAALATEHPVKDLESDTGLNCFPSQTTMAFPSSVPTHSRHIHNTDMEMTAMSTFDFRQLPIELSQEIVMLAAAGSSVSELATLCRVCKTFHNWVTPHCEFLYHAARTAWY